MNKKICLCLLFVFCLGLACACAETFILPGSLIEIEEEAFAGIGAAAVQIPGSVRTIGKRAFAGAPNLREIYIPDTVETIADDALDGCGPVTVYGVSGTEAQRFAAQNDFAFKDTSAAQEIVQKTPALTLPFVPAH